MDSSSQPAPPPSVSPEEIAFLRRALELAEAGRGLVSPNPMVGAVLVRGGQVVGEGTYTYERVRHAEICALEQAGGRARGATLYINLEPCCHQGRTPPCASALVAAGVSRVVAGMRDPNPLVAGGGFACLRDAGVTVVEGVLAEECRRLNEHFIRYIQGGVFVTLKAAMTLDGRIAPAGNAGQPSGRFTSPDSLACVHRLRHAHDAIVTGIGTVLADDPLLTDRSGLPRGRSLLRVVLDTMLRLPAKSSLVQSARGDVLVIASACAPEGRARELERCGVEVLRCAEDSERPAWPSVLAALRQREIASLLLEAGAGLNASALAAGVVDKVVLFYAPKLLGGQDSVPLFAGPGFRTLDGARAVRIADARRIGGDVVLEGYLKDV